MIIIKLVIILHAFQVNYIDFMSAHAKFCYAFKLLLALPKDFRSFILKCDGGGVGFLHHLYLL